MKVSKMTEDEINEKIENEIVNQMLDKINRYSQEYETARKIAKNLMNEIEKRGLETKDYQIRIKGVL